MIEEKPIPLELNSLKDIVKMVSTSPANQPNLFHFKKKEQSFLASFIIMPGYYNYRGLPLLIFTKVNESALDNCNFIKYDLREDAEEQISFVKGVNQRDLNTGFVQFIPIIKVKNFMLFTDVEL